MAEIARKTTRYPSDLTNEEWESIDPLMPKPPRRGHRIGVDLREMPNAIRYMARSGGGWRRLPHNLGPWQTVYWWFHRSVRRMLFQTIHEVSLMLDRELAAVIRARPAASCIRPRWPCSRSGCGLYGLPLSRVVPRRQLVGALLGMVGDAAECVGEPGARIDVVEL